PKLGDLPAVQSNILARIAADIYTYSYNYELSKELKKLQKNSSFKAKIFFVDIYSELESAVNMVKKFGSYTPDFFVPDPSVTISNIGYTGIDYYENSGIFPANYLFWDEVHPTTQGHQLIAGLILKSLS